MFGRHGQLGSALAEILPSRYETKFVDQPDVDMAAPSSLGSIVTSWRPNIVVNAAAYTAVDEAEHETDLAFKVNAEAPAVIASACKDIDAVCIHFSTDYVFDGNSNIPYTETSLATPRTIYGKSKLAGEAAIIEATDRHVILRTAWLYSTIGNNFLKTMLRLAQTQKDIGVVADQMGSPTYVFDLARVTEQIINILQENVRPSFGIFHAVNRGVTSWHGFATKIFELSGYSDLTVRAIGTEEYPTPAPRPRYTALSCERLERVFGVMFPVWEDALSRCLKALKDEKD